MAMVSPTGLYPSFSSLATNRGLIEGIMFDLGNKDSDYIAGKIASPVSFPQAARENEMGIDARGLHGRIARMGMWGAFGTARSSKVAFGQRAIPVEGQPFDPLTYEGTKYFNSFGLDAETVAEIEELGVDALAQLLSIPRKQVLVNREAEWAAMFGTVANWSTTAAAATAWDQSGSTPLEDIQDMRADLAHKGCLADTIIISAPVAFALAKRLGYTATQSSPFTLTPDIVNDDQLVSILKAKFAFANVYIGRALTETSPIPNTSVTDFVWGDAVWVGQIGEALSANSNGNVSSLRQSAVASIMAQPLFADIVPALQSSENDDVYTARVRMIESLNIVYPNLGGTITGVLTP